MSTELCLRAIITFMGYGFASEDDKHNVQVIVTGAPQIHNQRTNSFYNMADAADYEKYGIRYNYNHGYLNGQEFNWRRNFYHKPIASVNWEYKINESTNLSASAYYSVGRGGGTGDIGRLRREITLVMLKTLEILR